jgi:hypothetical protein
MPRFPLWSCALVLACSSSGGSVFDNGTIGGPSNNPGGTITTGADGPCDTREDKVGCACTTDGASRECWPGLVGQSHNGLCRPGTQICAIDGSKEFVSQTWGACMGYSLPAEGCGNTSDGTGGGGNTSDGAGGSGTGSGGGNTGDGAGGTGTGTGSGGRGNTDDGEGGGRTGDGTGGYNGFGGFGTGFGGFGTGFGGGNTGDGAGGSGTGWGGRGNTDDGAGGSGYGGNGYGGGGTGGGRTGDGSGGGRTRDGDVCACPGQIRWCDDPVFCNWGNQTCLPDGTWGPCAEVQSQPQGCDPGQFDEACCQRLGLCCAWNNRNLVGPCQANGCP